MLRFRVFAIDRGGVHFSLVYAKGDGILHI